jgi:hypothetical protein
VGGIIGSKLDEFALFICPLPFFEKKLAEFQTSSLEWESENSLSFKGSKSFGFACFENTN